MKPQDWLALMEKNEMNWNMQIMKWMMRPS